MAVNVRCSWCKETIFVPEQSIYCPICGIDFQSQGISLRSLSHKQSYYENRAIALILLAVYSPIFGLIMSPESWWDNPGYVMFFWFFVTALFWIVGLRWLSRKTDKKFPNLVGG